MNPHDRRIVDQFTRWARPFAELPIHAEAGALAQTIAACKPSFDSDCLDVACGPGILACALAEHARHVTGIDLTPAMIGQARSRQAAMRLDNLEWHVGNATALLFADASFDRVVTRYSFHHMPDPASALAEMKRVCRPGGRVVVVDATPDAAKQRTYDAMERLRDPSHASALTVDGLRTLGRHAGLREIRLDAYRLEARLDTLADTADMPALTALFDEDIAGGMDAIGVGAWRAPDGIRFHFPVSIVAWQR